MKGRQEIPFQCNATITIGHDYLLMVTNWTRSTTGTIFLLQVAPPI
ncbi:MAG: hypothetical protein IPH68_14045 [Chitinophagaceae bacterium]|nr:hypothetical protein [Chitinophagaceae bacterium]